MRYVLDAWAVLAWMQKEKGYLRVRELLQESKIQQSILMINIVNFGEVFYIVAKNKGLDTAKTIERKLRMLPIKILSPVEENIVLQAARFKALHPISYADAFAASTAKNENAQLVTGDNDFKTLEKDIDIEWLR